MRENGLTRTLSWVTVAFKTVLQMAILIISPLSLHTLQLQHQVLTMGAILRKPPYMIHQWVPPVLEGDLEAHTNLAVEDSGGVGIGHWDGVVGGEECKCAYIASVSGQLTMEKIILVFRPPTFLQPSDNLTRLTLQLHPAFLSNNPIPLTRQLHPSLVHSTWLQL